MKLQKSNVRASVAATLPTPVITDPACPICQEVVGRKSPEGVKEGWALTPCGHAFGSVCIKRYLAITDKPLCPVCRQDVYHYCCSHPVLPALYDLQKRTTRTSYPWDGGDPRNSMCPYCSAGKNNKSKSKDKDKDKDRDKGRASSDGGSGGGGGGGSGTITTSRFIWISWTLPRRLTGAALRFAHFSKTKGRQPEPESEPEPEIESDADEEDEEADQEHNNEEAQSPSSANIPPVPGPYGRWDLATQEPDWKFLKWFDAQEPKTNASADVMR